MRTTAIVLAGGASRRMGRDKALLALGGRCLLQRAADEVSAVSDEVIIAARGRRLNVSGRNLRWVPDFPGAEGPLAGFGSGLAAASHDTAFLVACDMPFISGALLRKLADSLGECDAIVPLCDGVPQPLHAVYHRRSLPTVQSLLRLGERSFRALLPRLQVKYVPEERCLETDPSGLSWFNLNRPEEYSVAQQIVGPHGISTAA